MGILDIILIVNVILKLLNLITWSWGIVLWPLWVSIGIVILMILLK